MDETKKKPAISPTQLALYERCGEAYRRSYIENEKIPPGVSMLRGTGVHGGAKHNWKQKIDSHADLPKNCIVEVAVATYEKEQERGFTLTPDEEKVGAGKVLGAAKDIVAVLSGLYADQVAPAYQPVLVEHEQRLEVTAADFDLLGFIDLLDDKAVIVDLKTGMKKASANAAHESEQLSFYALLFRALTGKLPAAVRLENLIHKKEPERQPLTSTRTMEDLTILVNRINTMIDGIKKGVFIPANQAYSWWCSPAYCGYCRTCKYFKLTEATNGKED